MFAKALETITGAGNDEDVAFSKLLSVKMKTFTDSQRNEAHVKIMEVVYGIQANKIVSPLSLFKCFFVK